MRTNELFLKFHVGIFLLFLAILTKAGTVHADQLEIKGIHLGLNLENVKALQPEFFCGTYSTLESDTACYFKGLLTYAGARADLSVYLKEDKVTTVWVTIDSDDFENVVLALTEKLGKPSSVRTEKVKNLSGAVFSNPSFHWVKKGAILSAIKFSGKISESRISLSEFNVIDSIKKRKDDVKKRSQDL